MSATTGTIPDYGSLGERAAAGLKPKQLSDKDKVARAREAFVAGLTGDMAGADSEGGRPFCRPSRRLPGPEEDT